MLIITTVQSDDRQTDRQTEVNLVEMVQGILQLATTVHCLQPDLTPLCEQVANTRVLKHRLGSPLTIHTPTQYHTTTIIITAITTINHCHCHFSLMCHIHHTRNTDDDDDDDF